MSLVFNNICDNLTEEFDSAVTDSGDLSSGAAGGQAGTGSGLICVIDDTTAIYGQMDLILATRATTRYRVYLDPNGLTMASGDEFRPVRLLAAGTIRSQVQFGYNGSNYTIAASVRNDNATNDSTGAYTITDASHYIEVLVQYATSAVANDGVLTLWIDGVQQETITNIDLYTTTVPDTFRVGAVSALDAGTSGTFYLDEVVLRDDATAIGAALNLPQVPLVSPAADNERRTRTGDFTPTFDWDDPGGAADRVQIQVADNTTFTSPDIDQTILTATATQYTATSTLAAGDWYVRLRSGDGSNYGVWNYTAYEIGIYPRAFPGAEGAGAYTPGGRDGTILTVSNTNNSGAGSFRAAVEASGARIVVFTTGGTVMLSSEINIRDPYLTIAGQTAPGDGFCVGGEPVRIETHDVIVRYLRFRTGDTATSSNNDCISLQMDSAAVANATRRVRDIIIDHCSFSWGEDESVSIWNDEATLSIQRITIQWSMIYEALGDGVGGASRGLITGYDCDNMSIHHNLFVHNRDRNARVRGGKLHFSNNILYNTRNKTRVYTYDAGIQVNFVGNYHLTGGPDEGSNNMIVIIDDTGSEVPQFYVEGNIGQWRTSGTADEWDITSNDFNSGTPAGTAYQSLSRFSITGGAAISEQDYLAAYNAVLAGGGCNYPSQDSADARIISDVQSGTAGGLIDSQTEVGGWPTLAAGTPSTDTDSDGMPDWWENSRGLNPSVDDATGYTLSPLYNNIEVYFNGLVASSAQLFQFENMGNVLMR